MKYFNDGQSTKLISTLDNTSDLSKEEIMYILENGETYIQSSIEHTAEGRIINFQKVTNLH